VVNHQLLRAEATHPYRSLLVYDLAGIAYFSNDISVFWDGPFTPQLVADCYTPEQWDTLGHLTNDPKCAVFWGSPSPHQTTTWVSAIIKHPLAYAEHRLAHFNSELAFLPPRHHPKIQDVLRSIPIFTPIFALAIAFLVLFLTFPHPTTKQSPLQIAAFCLVTSGLFYMLAYLIVGVASEPRYHYWDMIAVFLAAAICFSERQSYQR
jgi:hypothetical protein